MHLIDFEADDIQADVWVSAGDMGVKLWRGVIAHNYPPSLAAELVIRFCQNSTPAEEVASEQQGT